MLRTARSVGAVEQAALPGVDRPAALFCQPALQHDSSMDEDEHFALVSALVEAALLLSPGQPVIENREQPLATMVE
jgi:hypothetical protein